MPTYRLTYWPTDRMLVEDVRADAAVRQGAHQLLLVRGHVLLLTPRLVVVRRLDLRIVTVEECPNGHDVSAGAHAGMPLR